MIGVTRETHDLRVLDFDIECRPIAWYAGEWVTKQPTVIAWKWVHEPAYVEPRVAWIGRSGISARVLDEEEEMILEFLEVYDRAEMVTGHFIRGFDLPTLNGACMRLGMPGLGSKLASDTKLDLDTASGLSKSMENLSAMFEAEHQKFPMNTALWARSNMLLPDGIELAKTRCQNDVVEHIELRERMIDLDVLAPPRDWSPRSSGVGGYHA